MVLHASYDSDDASPEDCFYSLLEESHKNKWFSVTSSNEEHLQNLAKDLGRCFLQNTEEENLKLLYIPVIRGLKFENDKAMLWFVEEIEELHNTLQEQSQN